MAPDSEETILPVSYASGLWNDAEAYGGRGKPGGIVGQKYSTHQILPGRYRTSSIGALIPGVSEGKALSTVKGKKPERAEHCLPSESAPDHSPSPIGNSKIRRRFSSHEVQRH
jgi:hypothetical protein